MASKHDMDFKSHGYSLTFALLCSKIYINWNWCFDNCDTYYCLWIQDSLLDIVTSLGCDEEKIILAGTAMANKFNLLDMDRNTPGSASVGKHSPITYQQVIA